MIGLGLVKKTKDFPAWRKPLPHWISLISRVNGKKTISDNLNSLKNLIISLVKEPRDFPSWTDHYLVEHLEAKLQGRSKVIGKK